MQTQSRSRLHRLIGPAIALSLLSFGSSVVPAVAMDRITTSCTDGTGHQMAATALFGQTTADAAFNAGAGQALGISCSTS